MIGGEVAPGPWRRIEAKVPKGSTPVRVGKNEYVAHWAWDNRYPRGAEKKVTLWVQHRLWDAHRSDNTSTCFECDEYEISLNTPDVHVTGRKLPTDMRNYFGSRPPIDPRELFDQDEHGRYKVLMPGDVHAILLLDPRPFREQVKMGGERIAREFDRVFELQEAFTPLLLEERLYSSEESERLVAHVQNILRAAYLSAQATFQKRRRPVSELWSLCYACGFGRNDPKLRVCEKCGQQL